MRIRFASEDDSRALLNIYGQYINTPITFEYILPARDVFARRIADITGKYPYLVCEKNGTTIGYAYARGYGERAAYQWNAELSVYLDQSFTGKGIGKRLYRALIDILRQQGIKTVYGVVTVPNEKSEQLHLSLGFKTLGIYHCTGYKCGKWHDVQWFEKQIAPYDSEPAPIVPIHKISAAKIESIAHNHGFVYTDYSHGGR